MAFRSKKLVLIATTLCFSMVIAQSFALKHHDHDDMKAKNLKVLPKDISMEQLHHVMKGFSKALGVRCDFCHVKGEGMIDGHPRLDFASDDKPEKEIARSMIQMVDSINAIYIDKMGDHNLEHISCITCHNGDKKPASAFSDKDKDSDND